MSSAPDSERAITFGSFSLLGFALRPRLLLTKLARWRGGSGAWLPFSFSFGVVVTPRILKKELEWDSPSGCSSFSLRGCPASTLAVAGNGCRVLQACLFFGTITLFPSETLLLPSSAPRYRLLLSGCACLGLQPCGKCLRLCLQKVPYNRPRSWSWLSSRLFLVERSSDGLASSDRFLSPGRMCLARSVHDGDSHFCAVSVRE